MALSRQHCPEIALGHFSHIHDLKDCGAFANFLPLALGNETVAKLWFFGEIQIEIGMPIVSLGNLGINCASLHPRYHLWHFGTTRSTKNVSKYCTM